MPLAHRPAAQTERNRWLAKMGGATVLGRDLADARVRVNCAIAAHRRAQVLAAGPYPSQFNRKPASTRGDVLKAVADVREVEQRIAAKYPAPVAAHVFLMAAE